jgi:hypothetical protein
MRLVRLLPDLGGCGMFPTVASCWLIQFVLYRTLGSAVAVLPAMPVARRLEDRIRDLCTKAVAAGSGELNPVLSELKAALHEHTQRLRRMAAASTLRSPREFPPERRSGATGAESR